MVIVARHDRRIMRHMVVIAGQQLQRVLAGRQIDHSLGLTTAKVAMLLVGGDRIIEILVRSC
jgi:hypothetical protein